MPTGLAILAKTMLLLLAAVVAKAVWARAKGRRAMAIRSAKTELFFARRLHALACRWSACGSTGTGLIVCAFAHGRLLEAKKGLAGTGDDDLIDRIDQEIGRNAELAGVCSLGQFRVEQELALKEAALTRALEGARIRLRLDEAEGLFAQGAALFAARRYRAARVAYREARYLLSCTHREARLSGRPELLPAIRAAWEVCCREVESCDEWIVDSGFDTLPRLRLYVDGRIDPYFRRDDGSAPARPDRPGFWGATGHLLYQ